MKTAVFWGVTPCSLVVSNQFSMEAAASIFRADDRDSMILRYIDDSLSDYKASHSERRQLQETYHAEMFKTNGM
jgi:hypothetical protein